MTEPLFDIPCVRDITEWIHGHARLGFVGRFDGRAYIRSLATFVGHFPWVGIAPT